jgi:RNA-directed DNA polymerase
MTKTRLLTTPDEQRNAFFALKTRRDLALLLNYRYEGLVYQLYKVQTEKNYEAFFIQKKSGELRTIHAPSPKLKHIQRRLNDVLQNVYLPKPVVFGFTFGKNIVDNADKHKKKNWVLNIDLENFFPSINFGRVRGMFMHKPYNLSDEVATTIAKISCFDNSIPQGAPTSPAISNMICAQMDSQLQDLAWKNRCFYTRYADDITFSTTLHEFPLEIAKVNSVLSIDLGQALTNIIQHNGFEINHSKVRAFAYFQRQEVTGLTVNKFPNVRRKFVMQIRSMLHAWDKKGLQVAEAEHYKLYNKKHRNPNSKLPAYKKVVKGKIDFFGMVKGRNNSRYMKFKREYLRLSRRDKNVPFRNISAKTESQIIIYTEGPTDPPILKTAWQKLYQDEILFIIAPVEIKPGIATGAIALVDELNTHRKQHGIVIGIFDRDAEGIRAYKSLHSEFEEKDGFKISIDRNAAAILLPIPAGKEKLANLDKLWIENYFSETVLNTKTNDEKGLVFEYKPVVVTKRIESKVIEETITDEKSIETAVIKSGKRVFAEKIVPTLSVDEFRGFELVFEKINEIAELLQDLE